MNCVCVCVFTLSGRLVVAGVESSGEGGRGIRDVSVEMAPSAAISEPSHAERQDHAQQQGHHQTSVHCYTHTRS